MPETFAVTTKRLLPPGAGEVADRNLPPRAPLSPSRPAMDAQHASRGRRTLEEIRQKRAAERFHKASSGSEAEIFNPYAASNMHGENRSSEDSYALIYRTQELENVKSRLENENQKLRAKLDEKEADIDSLIKRLGDLEQDSLPSLRKAVKDLSIEKDAVFVAKEDALAQLRTIKKQLKEAEEEQYRAEEDAAALRAELNNFQRQGFTSSFGGNLSSVKSAEDTLAMEREIEHLRSLLQIPIGLCSRMDFAPE